jgi:hypothetical protein
VLSEAAQRWYAAQGPLDRLSHRHRQERVSFGEGQSGQGYFLHNAEPGLTDQLLDLSMRHGPSGDFPAKEPGDAPPQTVSVLVIVEDQHAGLTQVSSQDQKHRTPQLRFRVGKEPEGRDQVELPAAEDILLGQIRLQ